MPLTTALYNAYYEQQKEREKEQAGVTYWEDIFKAPYKTAAEQVQAASAYDISGAYSAYKRNQLNLMTQQQLGEGFKESIADQLRASYEQQYSGIRQTEASNLLDIQSAYEKQLASQEERVAGMAKFYSDLEKSMYEFAGIEDLSLIERGIDYANEANSGYGFYRLNPETGEYEQTEYGKSFMKDVIESGDYVQKNMYGKAITEDGKPISMGSFSNWLAENNPELYEQYVQNVDAVREMVGGYEYAKYEEAQKMDTLDKTLDDFKVETYKEYMGEGEEYQSADWIDEIALKKYNEYKKENLSDLGKQRENDILEQTKNLNVKELNDFIKKNEITDETLINDIKNNNKYYSNTLDITTGYIENKKHDNKTGRTHYTINGKTYRLKNTEDFKNINKTGHTIKIDPESYEKIKKYKEEGWLKEGEVFDVSIKFAGNRKMYLIYEDGKFKTVEQIGAY